MSTGRSSHCGLFDSIEFLVATLSDNLAKPTVLGTTTCVFNLYIQSIAILYTGAICTIIIMSNYFALDGLPKVSQLLIENEKVQRKLRKVQQRRDHYAKLYYKTLAELDETKWELSLAKSKIKDLQEKCEFHPLCYDLKFTTMSVH